MDDERGEAGMSGRPNPRATSLPWRLAAHPLAPTVLAVALALLALPVTIASMASVESVPLDGAAEAEYLKVFEAALGSIGAVLAGALAGGTLGGLVVRRRPLFGAAIALVVAWPSAIVGFAVLPGLTGHAMAVGKACTDSCSPALALPGSLDLFEVLVTYGTSVMWSVLFFGWVALAALIAVPVAVVLGLRWPWAGRAVGYAAIAVAWLGANLWSVSASGAAYPVLVIGVGAWAVALGHEASRPSMDAAPPPLEAGAADAG